MRINQPGKDVEAGCIERLIGGVFQRWPDGSNGLSRNEDVVSGDALRRHHVCTADYKIKRLHASLSLQGSDSSLRLQRECPSAIQIQIGRASCRERV